MLCVACGGSSGGTTTQTNVLNGNIKGSPLPQLHAVAGLHTAAAGGSDYSALALILSKTYSTPTGPATFAITSLPDSTGVLAAGDYAAAAYFSTDATCAADKSQLTVGTSGQVVLDTFAATPGGKVSGHLTIAFDSGDQLSGTFDTTLCASAGSSNICQ